ncbi:MAG: hypothetical protein IT337_04735 [Thermomicrobiales bacterium]|nr:hypothetical protein [Thermomicrobiales bacterium]
MRTFDLGETRRLIAGLAVAGMLSVAVAGGVSAQDTGAAGNGGGSNANADGGAVTMGDVGSGGSSGSSADVASIVADAIANSGTDHLAADVIAAILGN